MLRSAGHRVDTLDEYAGEPVDMLVALHARKSASSALRFRRQHPRAPLIVVMTGTDLYRDIRGSRMALRAMRTADALVVLQPEGIRALPAALRKKARAIIQSSNLVPLRRPRRRAFLACIIGHLRYEKDPLRCALASRLVEPGVPLRVVQAGGALSPRFARSAVEETKRNPRYRWLGELAPKSARKLLATSDLMVISSRMEGGANVVCEALAAGVPVLASDIPGNTGILGRRYAGLYPVGDTRALAALLERAATDRKFYRGLRRWCARLRPLVDPARERKAWADLVAELRPT